MPNPDRVSKETPAVKPDALVGVLGALVLLLLAASGIARAQSQPSPLTPWTRIPYAPKMTPDESWGIPEYDGRGGPRMTSDAEGTLFISNGGNLYMGRQEGRSWKTAPVQIAFYVPFPVGLAVGGTGQILWGDWSSMDGGQTWSSFPMFPRSYAIGPHGTALAGAGPEAIFRNTTGGASGSPWNEVKYGDSYQSITYLTFAFPGWAFAAMPQGDLWISRTDGASWFPLQDMMEYFFNGPGNFSLPTMEKGPGARTLWTLVSDSNSHPLWCEGFQRHGDTALLPLSPDNAGFPDSAITALQAYAFSSGPPILLLGTWGQGVYVSRDQAATWEKFNGGLTGDLHVEAINFSASGNAQVLTKDGLFGTSAFAPMAIQKKNGKTGKNAGGGRQGNIRGRGASPLFENGSGRFHADGRMGGVAPQK